MLKQSVIFAIKEIFTLKVLVMFLIFALVSVSEIGFGQRTQLTAIEFMIHVFAIAYLICLAKLKKNKNIMILVRQPRFFDYWKCVIVGLFSFTSLLIFCHILISAIIAFLNFPLELAFTDYPIEVGASTLILYRELGHPLRVFLQIIGFQVLGLVYLGTVVRCLELYLTEKRMVMISMISIVMAMAAIRTSWDSSIPYLTIHNYFILHHPLLKGVGIEILMVMFAVFILMTLIAKKSWGVKRYV